METPVDQRVVRLFEAVASGGIALKTRTIRDGTLYAMGAGRRKALAYIQPRKDRLRVQTSKRLAESIDFEDWDEETWQWFGTEASVELLVEDGNAEQEAKAIRLLRGLAAKATRMTE
jgi:hypothetical protein